MFRRTEPTGGRTPGASLAVLAVLLLAVAIAATRSLWMPSMPEGIAIEVRGEVPRPGHHLVHTPTIRAAIEAAGGDGGAFADGPLREGDRVLVEGGRATVQPPSDPLLIGLPIDLNACEAAALAAVPGIARSTAEAIVAHREQHGPFRTFADLEAVPGVGPATVEKLAPFVTFGAPP